jgi:hypothetical protein
MIKTMSAKKSPLSIRKATEQVFAEMPETFHAIFFCARVKVRTGRAALMDGTILRRLRKARNENSEKFNYRCIDNEKSIYQKITA